MEKLKNLSITYHIMSTAFCVIVIISNIISAKMVHLPFFQNFSIPAGLITYPFAFLLSNLVMEIYGKPQARLMVYTTFGMNILAFGMIYLTLILPADLSEEQHAFQTVMSLGGLRIFSSLFAYMIAQIVDIQLYALIKRWTGLRFLWLRNNGSTCVSQLVDTIVIDVIFLYYGLGMQMTQILPIMLISYFYKMLLSAANTPLLYLLIFLIRRNWNRMKIFSWYSRSVKPNED